MVGGIVKQKGFASVLAFIVFAVVAVVILGAVNYLGSRNYRTQNQSQVSPIIAVNPTAITNSNRLSWETLSLLDTKDWSVYDNKHFRYRLKYPSSWEAQVIDPDEYIVIKLMNEKTWPLIISSISGNDNHTKETFFQFIPSPQNKTIGGTIAKYSEFPTKDTVEGIYYVVGRDSLSMVIVNLSRNEIQQILKTIISSLEFY